MSTCSICLAEVRSTRINPPIRCGHIFHTHCLEKWKSQGKHTCPTCRRVFDVSQYKIDVTISNICTHASNVVSLNEDSIFNVFDRFNISFEAQYILELNSILSDLGITLADFDTAILDAE